MTNWKRLYTDASKMLAMYQDEIVPGLRKELENRVEVVRCKDCVFCHYNSSNETYKCTSMNGMYRTVNADDFCSYGERKDNG